MHKVKMLFYGINGTGLGHISRLLAVARSTRDLLHAMRIKADFHLVTTSEAPQIAWDFPVYKLPSKTVIRDTDTNNLTFAAVSQFFVTNLVALIRPDILVMDTIPQGSFGEFLLMKTFCDKKVLIDRHKNSAITSGAVYLSHLSMYDLILTPDHPSKKVLYSMPEEMQERNVFTGVVHGVCKEELLSKKEVRRLFGVADDQTLIYVSAGGGGDKSVEKDIRALVGAISQNMKHFVLVGYGPLYRGEKIYKQNVVPLSDPDSKKYFGGIDLAFSAAGYNTFEELLATKVPTTFFSQAKGMDCQEQRIDYGMKNGWNRKLQNFDPLSIEEEVEALKRSIQEIRRNLNERKDLYGALVSAVEMLKLHSSIEHSPIEYRLIFLVAQLKKYWANVCIDSSGCNVSFAEAASCAIEWVGLCKNDVEYQSWIDGMHLGWVQNNNSDESSEDVLRVGRQLALIKKRNDLSDSRFANILKSFVKEYGNDRIAQLDCFIYNRVNNATQITG